MATGDCGGVLTNWMPGTVETVAVQDPIVRPLEKQRVLLFLGSREWSRRTNAGHGRRWRD